MITRGHMKGPSDKNRVLNTKNLQDGQGNLCKSVV